MNSTLNTSEAKLNIPCNAAEQVAKARKARPADPLFSVAREPQEQARFAAQFAQDEMFGDLEQILARN